MNHRTRWAVLGALVLWALGLSGAVYGAGLHNRSGEVSSIVPASLAGLWGLPITPSFVMSGELRQGHRATSSITVALPGRYRLSAVCVDECDGLELWLWDASGTLIAVDEGTDASSLTARLDTLETYTLEVVMYSCPAERCGYAVQIEPGKKIAPRLVVDAR